MSKAGKSVSNPDTEIRDTIPQPVTETSREPAVLDQTGKAGGIGSLLLVGLFLLVMTGTFLVLPADLKQPVMLAGLGLLAMIGVFFLFALAIGFIHLSVRARGDAFARSFVDNLDAGALVTDSGGRIVYANHAYADLTGAETARDVMTVDRFFSHASEVNEIIYRLNQKVRGGKAAVEEFRVVDDIRTRSRPDEAKEPHWYRVSARPLSLQGHAKPLTVWQVRDITVERTQQEQAFVDLQHAIDYLDHAPAGFFSAEPNGAIVYLNATLADWLGIDLTQFVPGDMTIVDLVQGDGAALLDTLAVDPGETKTAIIDLDMTRSNGKILPVRLYHKVPFAHDGAPGATRTLVLNRSAGDGDPEESGAAEMRFTRFFNNTPMAIASIGTDGKIIKTNAPFQKLFAPVIAAARGTSDLSLSQLVPKESRELLNAALEAAFAGQAKIDPVDADLPGGIEVSVRYYLSAVTDAEDADDPERAIVYAVEMTEQRALETAMMQGQKMQAVGQLAGGIAHDFNNVLTAIIGFSDLLLANHRPSDPSFPDIMNIKQNANRAASLVRQLLAFSRRQTLRPQVLSVSDVLADLRMLLDRLLGDKVDLELKHGRDLWPLKADIGQFEQVVVNLCVNARDAINDAGEDGGTVTIKTSNLAAETITKHHYRTEMPAADYVLVEVMDTGTGMNPETMTKIFDPFFSTKEVGKGTGLGLSTVYGIIKQSGGFIYPESAPGKGTTFRIYLPRHLPTEAEISASAAAAELPKEKARDLAGTATIVFVEDEDAVRAVGCRTLEARGYKVHEAENGAEALELIEDLGDEIDLVVSDVVMPEMDGPTLLTEVRKSGSDLKFIFASGYAEDAFEKNLPETERGQFGFIPKPYSLKQLATAVKEALEEVK